MSQPSMHVPPPPPTSSSPSAPPVRSTSATTALPSPTSSPVDAERSALLLRIGRLSSDLTRIIQNDALASQLPSTASSLVSPLSPPVWQLQLSSLFPQLLSLLPTTPPIPPQALTILQTLLTLLSSTPPFLPLTPSTTLHLTLHIHRIASTGLYPSSHSLRELLRTLAGLLAEEDGSAWTQLVQDEGELVHDLLQVWEAHAGAQERSKEDSRVGEERKEADMRLPRPSLFPLDLAALTRTCRQWAYRGRELLVEKPQWQCSFVCCEGRLVERGGVVDAHARLGEVQQQPHPHAYFVTVVSPSHLIKLVHFHLQLLTLLMQSRRVDPLRHPQLLPTLLQCADLPPSLPGKSDGGRRERSRLARVGASALQAAQCLMDRALPVPVVHRVFSFLLPHWRRQATDVELSLLTSYSPLHRDVDLLTSPHSDEPSAIAELLARQIKRGGDGWPYWTAGAEDDGALEREAELVGLVETFLASTPLACLGPHLRSIALVLPLLILRCRSASARAVYLSLLHQLLLVFPSRRLSPLICIPLLFDPALSPALSEALSALLSQHPAIASPSPLTSSPANLLDLLRTSPSLPPHATSRRPPPLANGVDADAQQLPSKRQRTDATSPPAPPAAGLTAMDLSTQPLPLTTVPDTLAMVDSISTLSVSLSPDLLLDQLAALSSSTPTTHPSPSPMSIASQRSVHALFHQLLSTLLSCHPLSLSTPSVRGHFAFFDVLVRVCLPHFDLTAAKERTTVLGRHGSVTASLLAQLNEWIRVAVKLHLSATVASAASSIASPSSDAARAVLVFLVHRLQLLCETALHALPSHLTEAVEVHSLLALPWSSQLKLAASIGSSASLIPDSVALRSLLLLALLAPSHSAPAEASIMQAASSSASSPIRACAVYAAFLCQWRRWQVDGEKRPVLVQDTWRAVQKGLEEKEPLVQEAVALVLVQLICLSSAATTALQPLADHSDSHSASSSSNLPSCTIFYHSPPPLSTDSLQPDTANGEAASDDSMTPLALFSPILSATARQQSCAVCDDAHPAYGVGSPLSSLAQDVKAVVFHFLFLSSSTAVRVAATSAFFHLLRHLPSSDLLTRPSLLACPTLPFPLHLPRRDPLDDDTGDIHELPSPLNDLAQILLSLLLDDDPAVRQAAVDAASLLVDAPPSAQPLDPSLPSLPQGWDVSKGSGPLLLLFGEVTTAPSPAPSPVKRGGGRRVGPQPPRPVGDMEAALRAFIRALLPGGRDYDDSRGRLSLLPLAAVIFPLLPLAPQSLLLWTAIEHLADGMDSGVGQAAYSAVQAMAQRTHITVDALLSRHRRYVHPRLLRSVEEQPRLLAAFHTAFTHHTSVADFVHFALPSVLPQLIIDREEGVLRQLSSLCHTPLQELIVCYLDRILHHLLLPLSSSASAEAQQSFRASTATAQAFLSRHILVEQQDLTSMINLCGAALLVNVIWTLGDDDAELVKRAQHVLGLVLYAMLHAKPLLLFSSLIDRSADWSSSDFISEQLHPHFLMVLDRFDTALIKGLDNHTREPVTLHGKVAALRALSTVLRLLGVRAASFVSKLIAMLKMLMANDERLRMPAMEVWRALVDALGMQVVGPYLSLMVLTLLPYVREEWTQDGGQLASAVISFLHYLLIDNRDALYGHFQDLPLFPSLPSLSALTASISSMQGSVPLLDRLQQLMGRSNLGHESVDVRAGALEQLHSLFVDRRSELDSYSLDGSYAELISELTAHLLRLSNDTTPDIQRLCALCIGELGAIDPGHLSVELLITAPRRYVDEGDFRQFVVESLLVRAIKASTRTGQLNRAMFSVQEILRLVGCDAEVVKMAEASRAVGKGERRDRVVGKVKKGAAEKKAAVDFWLRLNEATRQTIEPCTTSEFVVENSNRHTQDTHTNATNTAAAEPTSTSAAEAAVGDDGTGGRKRMAGQAQSKVKGKDGKEEVPPAPPPLAPPANGDLLPAIPAIPPTFDSSMPVQRWLPQWTRLLINWTDGPRRAVFWACRSVVKVDLRVARELLPYLVDNVLRQGRKEHVDALKAEILAVLRCIERASCIPLSSHASPSPSTSTPVVNAPPNVQQATQLIFELIDHMTAWIHEEASSDPSHHHPSASSDSSTVNAAARADSPHLVLQADGANGRSVLWRKQFFDDIDERLLANAAYACSAFTRALKYFESHLHEERRRWRKAKQLDLLKLKPRETAAAAATVYDPYWLHAGFARLSKLDEGMADGLSADNLHLLQRLYASTDEPDGMSGIAALRSSSSLSEQVRDALSLSRWSDALTCYDRALQSDDGSLELHCGVLECNLNLGRVSEALIHVSSRMNRDRGQTWDSTIGAFGVQATWRMRRWEELQDFLQRLPARQRSFQAHLGDILAALHAGEEERYAQSMQAGRAVVMESLSTASMESYQRAYPFCLQLQMLQEIDHMRRLMGPVPSTLSSTGAARDDGRSSLLASLHQHWTLRLSRTKPSFKLREPLLAVRRVLYEEYGDLPDAFSTWLEVGHQARKAHQLDTAHGALLNADDILTRMPHADRDRRRDVDQLRLAMEKAKLKRAKDAGHAHDALMELERLNKAAPGSSSSAALSTASSPSSSTPREPVVSAAFLLQGKWHQELVRADYNSVYHLIQKAGPSENEKACFRLGEFHDRLLEERSRQKLSHLKEQLLATTKRGDEKKAADELLASIRRARLAAPKMLRQCLTCYGEALKWGHKYTFQCLPRMLTLYLEQAELTALEDEQLHERESKAREREREKDRDDSKRGDGGQSATSAKRATRATVATSATSSASSSDKQPDKDSLHAKMLELVSGPNGIAPYKWFTALPQLISRMCHPNPYARRFIREVLVAVLSAYPMQAIWSVGPVVKSKDEVRRAQAKLVYDEVDSHLRQHRPGCHQQLSDAMRLFDVLIDVCDSERLKQSHKEHTLSVKTHFQALHKTRHSGHVLVPVQSALTITLPSSAVSSSSTSSSSASPSASQARRGAVDTAMLHQAFTEHPVTIAGVEDSIVILSSKEKPRKLTVLGSDGLRYVFLCKKEVKGDMRKNSRMMDFCTVVNRLLKKNNDSRARQLRLRTFSVLPLTEECGLIEWVPLTFNFRMLVKEMHERSGIHMQSAEIKRLYLGVNEERKKRKEAREAEASSSSKSRDSIPPDPGRSRRKDDSASKSEQILYRHLLDAYPPLFHQWFLHAFPDPTCWFQSRLSYAHSVATWSMVGFVVGLGDRHGENILIDGKSGECVHVDFDCLFGKGLTLDTPERVPFRLTANIIDGLGLTGIEGVYRRSCEVTMGVMKENAQTLLSVLHTFLYDPLLEWKQAALADKGLIDMLPQPTAVARAGGASAGLSSESSMAAEKLSEVEKKLSGVVNVQLKDASPLSVNGQVNTLIQQACSEDNLAQMYMGWMPWI